MRRLGFIAVWLVAALSAQAANHYIRAGASGANNGTSWANAWTSFASVTWTRGDTYYVAGGTYTGNVTVAPALSGSLWVTIKKANTADNSGDAGWDAAYASTVATINGRLFLDNGYIEWNGVTGSWKSGHGFRIYNSAFSDVVVLEAGAGPFRVFGTEIEGAGCFASTIGYAGIYHNNVLSSAKGVHVAYCWIHEVTTNGVTFLGLVGTSWSDYGLLFEHNAITETGGCLDPDNHGQGMQLGQQSPFKFAIIRKDFFDNVIGSGMVVFLTSGPNADHQDILVANNIFAITQPATYTIVSPGVIWHEADGVELSRLTIANNVMWNITGGTNKAQIILEMSTADNVAYNNIWEGCQISANHLGLTAQSNNGYWNNNGAGIPSGTPNQVNGSATTFTNAAGGNFTLVAGGYAINAGTTVSLFSDDILGVSRPQGAVWDLGAYEYTGVATGSVTVSSLFAGTLIVGGGQ